MMDIIYSLASSSKGNACYIGNQTSGVLVDAGISLLQMRRGLAEKSIDISAIKGIFITHEHSDHISGLLSLTNKLSVPVYATRGTLNALVDKKAVCSNVDLRELDRAEAECNGFVLRSFRTPHDAACSSGYKIYGRNGKTACICTDLGVITPEVYENLYGSNAVLLEANYDEDMLINGEYPSFLKRRIASDYGHLSNIACADEVTKLFNDGTTDFMLGHLSAENNCPETAYEAVKAMLSACGGTENEDFTLKIAAGNFIDF